MNGWLGCDLPTTTHTPFIMPRLHGHFTHEPRTVTMKLWEPPKKSPKAIPKHFQNHVVWSRAVKCNVKIYVTMPLTKCYSNESLFMWGPHIWYNIVNQWLWDFKVPWSPGFVFSLLPRVAFGNSPNDHETWSIWCHVGLHAHLTSLLHSRTPLVPQA